jgi:hypothetical protein
MKTRVLVAALLALSVGCADVGEDEFSSPEAQVVRLHLVVVGEPRSGGHPGRGVRTVRLAT